MIPLRGQNLEGLQNLFLSRHLPKYRATQLAEWIYQKDAFSWEEVSTLPQPLRDVLSQEYGLHSIQLEKKKASEDGSVKFLFQVDGGDYIEAVLIPTPKRKTLCISTQVGCAVGCIFCASGKDGFKRNLTPDEILDQVSYARRESAAPLTNIVFMGMGEPLLNFDHLITSLTALTSSWGYGLSQRRISVSTSGIVPKIEAFLNSGFNQVKLCISLHAGNEELRTELVPINKKFSIQALKDVVQRNRHKIKRDLTLEYTVIKEVNDRQSDAHELAAIAKELKAKVNVIAYNPIPDVTLERPEIQQIERFRDILEHQGVRATVRYSAGNDVSAACGQLRRIVKS